MVAMIVWMIVAMIVMIILIIIVVMIGPMIVMMIVAISPLNSAKLKIRSPTSWAGQATVMWRTSSRSNIPICNSYWKHFVYCTVWLLLLTPNCFNCCSSVFLVLIVVVHCLQYKLLLFTINSLNYRFELLVGTVVVNCSTFCFYLLLSTVVVNCCCELSS